MMYDFGMKDYDEMRLCTNCIHWAKEDHINGVELFARCKREVKPGNQSISMMTDSGVVTTGAHFGCVNWKKKKDPVVCY